MTDLNLPINDLRFVVVDVETTGGTSGEHKLIEIAAVVVEGGEIIAKHESLINPHSSIPEFISVMTGITDDMVRNAPEEEDAVMPVIESLMSERAVFVAHNVGFDWNFVQTSIVRSGVIVPEVARLCTCKLSRRIHVDLKRHDLASVAEFCGIALNGRHRAMADTEATALALVKMIERCAEEHDAQTLGDLLALQYAPRTVTRRETKARQELAPYLNELPDEPGVYYFLSSKKNVLYVGKAKSLVKRVRSYFHDAPLHGRTLSRMVRYIKHIAWRTTGTELGAMLLESSEIKSIKPTYNRAQREYSSPSFLRFTNEDYPQLQLVDHVDVDGSEYFGPFRSLRMATRIQETIVRANKLRTCEGALKPGPDVKPCFDYHIKRCNGPCALHQSQEDYMSSVRDARDHLANLERGAASILREKMERAAEDMDFEHAAMLRDGLREIERMMLHGGDKPIAVNDIDLVIIVPSEGETLNCELFALHGGRLQRQLIVGQESDFGSLATDIASIYEEDMPPVKFSDRELDELRIITSWLYQRRDKAATIVVHNTSPTHIQQQIEEAIESVHARHTRRDLQS